LTPNPALKKLGFSPSDRLVILHMDDVGMCQAAVQAYADLWQTGTITSGAVMMPCPWAAAVAHYCREHPGVDMGVHTTITAEWETYRWSPLSTRDPASGLMDKDGFFPRTVEEIQASGKPIAVYEELRLQVQRALDWGVDVTHIDTHMAAVASRAFVPAYLRVAYEFRLPCMLPRAGAVTRDRDSAVPMPSLGLDAVSAQLEEEGLPLVDGLFDLPLDDPENQLELFKKLVEQLPVGITHFLMHPSQDTPELRAICPDWPSRAANYELFLHHDIRAILNQAGVQPIGYRDLKAIIPE
jgi:hypothetical protein